MNFDIIKFTCVVMSFSCIGTIQAQDIKIACKAKIQAKPFDLKAVKLSDGIYKKTLDLNYHYLLDFNTYRLVYNFRANAGLPNSVKPLGGWESPWCELRGHFTGHFLSALSLMYSATGDERLKLKADTLVNELAQVQQALGNSGYLSAFPESFIDRVEAGEPVWAPYYTLHKIYAGLIDAYVHFGNFQALETVKKMGDWVYNRNTRLTEEGREKMRDMEFGGMGESLWNLYALTGEERYKTAAIYFNHNAFLEPLKNYTDQLNTLHANTQFPKILAAARQYELTADPVYKNLSQFFWNQITHARTYVTGGNSHYEHFMSDPWKLADMLGPNDHENCNTHNMLKITNHLFCWEAKAEYADFYERALLNGILGTQHPQVAGTAMYYVPMKPGLFRVYCEPEQSYVCCSGTGIESYSKFGNSIYFHNEDKLWINQFIPSELSWEEKGMTVIQETEFPEKDHMTFTFKTKRPVKLDINLRVPYWATQGCILKLNGKTLETSSSPSSYISLKRTWKTGDKLEFTLPMSLHTWPMPDNPSRLALLYGPVVLAAAFGNEATTEDTRWGMGGECYRLQRDAATIDVPAIITDQPDWIKYIEVVKDSPLTFRTKGLGIPNDFILKPFYQVYGERYSLYTDVYTTKGWQQFTDKYRRFPEGIYDRIVIGDSVSTFDHNFQAYYLDKGNINGKPWVQSKSDFRFDMRIPQDKKVKLRVTYYGDETHTRYSLKIDGIAFEIPQLTKKDTNDFFQFEYDLPFNLTKGKKRIAIGYAVPQQKEVEIGATTVEKTKFNYITPKLFGAEILIKE